MSDFKIFWSFGVRFVNKLLVKLAFDLADFVYQMAFCENFVCSLQ